MMPISEIGIGDIFSNPMHRGYGAYSGLNWVVIEKNEKEKMIKIQGAKYATSELVGTPMWKKSSDRMFCESWRILKF